MIEVEAHFMIPTLADIQTARQELRDIIIQTPILPNERLSNDIGARVYLKAENTQRSGSFKIRGAYNKISRLTAAERARGIIAHSAGNHAQGVALAAKLFDIPATIVMPERAPLTKVVATRRLGAEIMLHGETFDDCAAFAKELQHERGLTAIHPFNDPDIIAGQGTLGLEIIEAVPETNVIIVPIGGGGLISGIALAVKTLMPDIRIIGVQAEGCAAVPTSLAAGQPVTVPVSRTIADGIAVKCPGELTLPIIQELVDEVVTVTDDEIMRAIAYAVQNAHLVVEGAGAASLAALISGKVLSRSNDTICVTLCGGNIDGNLLARIIEQSLVRQGRYILIRTTVDDRPGNLAPLISQVAQAGAGVVDIFHRRAVWLAPVDRAGIEMVLEVRDEQHGQTVVQHLTEAGYHVEREWPGLWPE
ncbi:MAG: threonine ammonia-lyase [Chloroflexi bacterium AL-W]|nr:threonine ammonia-lyase [Chloroflexi bacterium AL-N1]NOK69281.1 threonine ammonia-lyase [Chloroflexi bacterium AL-N10]NOK76342.1 threonine ammonia-lyase [Chloroflexi bacterium AL-N5]NOK83459.1 threonine ammonia-lyase [Chloroflexi bacterium AL-W]NOK91119.1 threonine ammonia-lyase [Chloroflexi bacterium AL-N15]